MGSAHPLLWKRVYWLGVGTQEYLLTEQVQQERWEVTRIVQGAPDEVVSSDCLSMQHALARAHAHEQARRKQVRR